MARQLLFDPTDEGTGTQLDVMAAPYIVFAFDAPAPRMQAAMAGSIDTEGESVAAAKHDNAPVTLTVDVIEATQALRDAAVAALELKVAKIAREGGTLRMVSETGDYRTADLLPADIGYTPQWDVKYDGGLAATVEISLLRRPYVRGVRRTYGYVTDDFSAALGSSWLFDSGSGTISATGGVLVPSDTTLKRLYRSDTATWTEARVTLKILTGAAVGGGAGPMAKRIDASNFLFANLESGNLKIYKVDAGVTSALGAGAAYAFAAATNYWIRFTVEGDVLTAQAFTSAPVAGSTAVATATHTLSGGDATKYGTGVAGAAGIRTDPGDTAYRYDDFKAEAYFETVDPVLIFTVDDLPGDVDGLGELVVSDDQAASQWWMAWAVQSKNYSASANAALFYEAESRTAMGGSATAVGSTGASGSGSNVMRNTALATNWKAIWSTQASGGGAHLSHIGTYRVYAHVQVADLNVGRVSIAFEWSCGDFLQSTLNASVAMPRGNFREEAVSSWHLINLGIVSLPAPTVGTQRWEGRVLAKSTFAGDDVDIDYLLLVPVAEGAGVASALARFQTATAVAAHDEFNQTGGNLTGKSLPAGGTWDGAGDPDDFTVNTGDDTAQRTAVSDSGFRFAIAGTTTFSDVAVQADVKTSAAGIGDPDMGVIARYADTSNFFTAYLTAASTTSVWKLLVAKCVAGSFSNVYSEDLSFPFVAGEWVSLRLVADSAGRWFVWVWRTDISAQPTLEATGWLTELATGGTLASGKTGLFDYNSAATAMTREYDNFLAFTSVSDAVIFSGQSAAIRHDSVLREDSAGDVWAKVSRYDGDYLRIPPAGPEDRTARFLVKWCRNEPATMPDQAMDDGSAVLYFTPRYLTFV